MASARNWRRPPNTTAGGGILAPRGPPVPGVHPERLRSPQHPFRLISALTEPPPNLHFVTWSFALMIYVAIKFKHLRIAGNCNVLSSPQDISSSRSSMIWKLMNSGYKLTCTHSFWWADVCDAGSFPVRGLVEVILGRSGDSSSGKKILFFFCKYYKFQGERYAHSQ